MEAIAGALGSSLQAAFDRWHEWALHQRDFIIGGKPGITAEEYDVVARRFAAIGIAAHNRASHVFRVRAWLSGIPVRKGGR